MSEQVSADSEIGRAILAERDQCIKDACVYCRKGMQPVRDSNDDSFRWWHYWDKPNRFKPERKPLRVSAICGAERIHERTRREQNEG